MLSSSSTRLTSPSCARLVRLLLLAHLKHLHEVRRHCGLPPLGLLTLVHLPFTRAEITAFSDRHKEFAALGTEVISLP